MTKLFKSIFNKLKKWIFSPYSVFDQGRFPTPARTKPYVKYGDMDGNVLISTQSQLDKRTHFKIGESYHLGECIVTLRASKEEVAKVIAYWDKVREDKEARLTERAIELMLMSPDELKALKLDEWLAKRKEKASRIRNIMSWVSSSRYIPPVDKVPSGVLQERFNQLVKNIKTKEKA